VLTILQGVIAHAVLAGTCHLTRAIPVENDP